MARLRGTGKRKPVLLMAHIDVVEAKREDWTTDPFQLVEKDGYFYGRGTGDDKYMAATFVSNLIRYKQEHYKPDRDLILVLETPYFVLTDTGGRYSLSGLPAGHYILKAWLDSRTTLEHPVDLRGDSTLEVNFP